MYFVQDGHHRVSVSRALGLKEIEANVTEIQTMLTPVGIGGRTDLERKTWRRLMLQRVPLTGEARAAVAVTDPVEYGPIAEMAEEAGVRGRQTLQEVAPVAARPGAPLPRVCPRRSSAS